MSIDKEIVKMDKSKAVVIGLTIDGSKIYTDYFDEIVEELCYHALFKGFNDFGNDRNSDPKKLTDFVFEQLAEIITKSACVITKKKMVEILDRGAEDLEKQFKSRCFGETPENAEAEDAEQQ